MTISYVSAELEQVPATITQLYLCPTTVNSAHVNYAVCCNEDGTDTTLTVNIIKNGDSADVTNQYIKTLTIAAGATEILSDLLNCVLQAGDAIHATAADADRLNLKLGVKEVRG